MLKKSIAASFIVFILAGCTYSNSFENGTPIAAENVNKIVKGKTTEIELIGMFGQPFAKSVVSANESKWVYVHTTGTASAQAFTMKTSSNAEQEMLDLLLKDGVVVNYAYTKTPLNPSYKSSTSL